MTFSYASLQLCNSAEVFFLPFKAILAGQEEDGDVPAAIHANRPAAVWWYVVFASVSSRWRSSFVLEAASFVSCFLFFFRG